MKIIPTQKQLEFLDWEFGMFFHFGIRSFFPGHTDWDGKPMPAAAFNPAKLDCKQWIRTAKNAGAKYAILTCKHHDGFANWQSKYSDYSVAQSNWESGHGDVVAEFVKACRAYDMKVGLYYSPAQWGGTVKFDNPVEYDDYFINQISELLTNYGAIDYLWFDGCGSDNHEYDKVRLINVIRKLQPGIRIFAMWNPDTLWVGNEDGYADMPNVNFVSTKDYVLMPETADGTCYLPMECDMKLRSAWFDCEANADTIKPLDELLGIYDYSVGRGANLLMNVGPNSDGLISDADASRLAELGSALRKRYQNALSFAAPAHSDGAWTISANGTDAYDPTGKGTMLVDTVVIEEDISEGQAVREFKVNAYLPMYSSKKICVYKGETIGHKAICHFPAVRTAKLSVEVTASDGEAKIKSVKAYRVNS